MGGGGGWHKASVSDCLPLVAPSGLSPLLILTLCGPERVLVVSTEPLDDLSCLTALGVGCPRDGLLPVPGGGGVFCRLSFFTCPMGLVHLRKEDSKKRPVHGPTKLGVPWAVGVPAGEKSLHPPNTDLTLILLILYTLQPADASQPPVFCSHCASCTLGRLRAWRFPTA